MSRHSDTSDHESFTVGDRPRVMASSGVADLSVTVGEPGSVEVHFPSGGGDRYRIQQSGDRITIRPEERTGLRTSISIELAVPPATDVKLATASGDIEVVGEVNDVDVSSASGDVHIAGAGGAVRIKSASGDIDVGDTDDMVEVTTVSGDVRLGDASGSVTIHTASGDIRMSGLDDICAVNSVSGDVAVRRCDASDISVRTMSGDVVLGLPSRRRVELDFESVAGDMRNDIEPGSGGEPASTISIRCRSVSGDLTLRSCE